MSPVGWRPGAARRPSQAQTIGTVVSVIVLVVLLLYLVLSGAL